MQAWDPDVQARLLRFVLLRAAPLQMNRALWWVRSFAPEDLDSEEVGHTLCVLQMVMDGLMQGSPAGSGHPHRAAGATGPVAPLPELPLVARSEQDMINAHKEAEHYLFGPGTTKRRSSVFGKRRKGFLGAATKVWEG